MSIEGRHRGLGRSARHCRWLRASGGALEDSVGKEDRLGEWTLTCLLLFSKSDEGRRRSGSIIGILLYMLCGLITSYNQ